MTKIDPVKSLSERDRDRWVEFVEKVEFGQDPSDICQSAEVDGEEDEDFDFADGEDDPEVVDFLNGHPCPGQGLDESQEADLESAYGDPDLDLGPPEDDDTMNEYNVYGFRPKPMTEPEVPENFDIGDSGYERAR
jgi:hypothetical protein